MIIMRPCYVITRKKSIHTYTHIHAHNNIISTYIKTQSAILVYTNEYARKNVLFVLGFLEKTFVCRRDQNKKGMREPAEGMQARMHIPPGPAPAQIMYVAWWVAWF